MERKKSKALKETIVVILLLFLIILFLGFGIVSILSYVKTTEIQSAAVQTDISQNKPKEQKAEKGAVSPVIEDVTIRRTIRKQIGVTDQAKETNPKEANPEEEKPKKNGDYILPDSGTIELKEGDLDELTKKELLFARNEIYARHGRKFKGKELQDYFNSKSWYSGIYEPEEFDLFAEELLNKTERKNAGFIQNYEKEKGYVN